MNPVAQVAKHYAKEGVQKLWDNFKDREPSFMERIRQIQEEEEQREIEKEEAEKAEREAPAHIYAEQQGRNIKWKRL